MKQSGQSLVELAISFVILIYLLGGAIEFGVAFFQFVQLRDAAQEGALYGSIYPNERFEIEQRVRGASNSPINLTDPSVTVTITTKDKLGNVKAMACEGDAMEVKVSYPHRVFMPFISKVIGAQDIILNAVVVNTVLQPPC